jgi:hypothetical protein
VLIEQAASPNERAWAAEPEISDETVRSTTGRSWNEWCDLIDAWPGHTAGHSAIAGYVEAEQSVDAWWAQTVTIGYERITGARLPYQQPDGSFTASRSRTVSVDADILRGLLLDDRDRGDLFPELETELRSRLTSKAVRIAIGSGVATISLDQRDDGRTRVAIHHQRLPSPTEVEYWQGYWSEWLSALDDT